MIAPARLLCVLMGGVAVLSLVLYAFPSSWPVFVAINLSLALVAGYDLLNLPRKRDLRAKRTLGHVATRGAKHPISVTIENRANRPFTGLVRDDEPWGIGEEAQEFSIAIPAKSRAALHYTITPRQRGSFELAFVALKTESRWKLWHRYFQIPCQDSLRVYPALKQIGRYALYARMNRMSLLGIRRQRRIGSENEFERLRDYSPDDQFRSIDWRATARRLKLTVRDFQTSQSQRVVFLIDCGRMMVNDFEGESLLDAAFDAALTLSYVTLAQNDQAGLLCFSDRVLRWLPPQSGRKQLNRMVHAVHDLHPQLVESRFDDAFMHLHQHCRKRTLVILITNVIDDQNASRLKAQVANLVGRHLPLTVLLKDHELFDPAHGIDPDVENIEEDKATLFRAAAAADILCWRRQVLTDLRQAGVLTLDCFPEQLTAPLVNEYMRIKGRNLL